MRRISRDERKSNSTGSVCIEEGYHLVAFVLCGRHHTIISSDRPFCLSPGKTAARVAVQLDVDRTMNRSLFRLTLQCDSVIQIAY